MFPVVDEAVVLGTPTAKQTSVAPEAHVLRAAALTLVAATFCVSIHLLAGTSGRSLQRSNLYIIALTQQRRNGGRQTQIPLHFREICRLVLERYVVCKAAGE